MQVKRFVASNMRDALKLVREEVGPDAVILSNKRITEGVEILVSLEELAEGSAFSLSAQSDSRTLANSDLSGNVNPFQFQAKSDDESLGTSTNTPLTSKLELEVERMQKEARQRAESLAATIMSKDTITAEPYDIEDRLNKKSLESLTSHIKTQKNLHQIKADKGTVNDLVKADLPHGSLDVQVDNAPQLEGEVTSDVKTSDYPDHKGSEIMLMRDELQLMRDLLEQKFAALSWQNYKQQKPQQASLLRRLKRVGLDSMTCEKILSLIPDNSMNNADLWRPAMGVLKNLLPIAEHDLISKKGIFAFVGPTGAGKTTTIGKLAARYVLKHGCNNIALVTMDSVRIAAHEQLRAIARILNVPIKIVDKNNSLDKVLYSLRHKELILVDTGGLSRSHEDLSQQTQYLNLANLQSVMVLPATAQYEVIKSAYHTYRADNLAACIYTKLDESVSLGGLISLSVEKLLPVAYMTNGQAVPDDIDVANSQQLIAKAIELAQHVKINNDTMVDTMTSISVS